MRFGILDEFDNAITALVPMTNDKSQISNLKSQISNLKWFSRLFNFTAHFSVSQNDIVEKARREDEDKRKAFKP